MNIHIDGDYAFPSACERGHFEIAKWFYTLGRMDIHANQDWALETAQ